MLPIKTKSGPVAPYKLVKLAGSSLLSKCLWCVPCEKKQIRHWSFSAAQRAFPSSPLFPGSSHSMDHYSSSGSAPHDQETCASSSEYFWNFKNSLPK